MRRVSNTSGYDSAMPLLLMCNVRDENNFNNDSAYGSRLHHVQHLIAPMRCGPTRYGFNVYTKTVKLDGTKPKRVCRKFNGDNKQIEALTLLLREHKKALMLDRGPTEQSRKNIEIVEELCGTVTQVDVCIRPHIVAKNKGSGKRIKGKMEITIEAGTKRAHRCHKCDQYRHHDCCNCTNVT
nr:protein FAR1-RELATED SEQUENCE 5-like [Ipomoea batatas]